MKVSFHCSSSTLPGFFSYFEDVLGPLTMGAVICTSRKTKGREHYDAKESEKSLRRKDTKDSIYDSADFIECSSLIHSNGKHKIKLNSKSEIHTNISSHLKTKTLNIKPYGAANCSCPLCKKSDYPSKYSSQRIFKNVWSRKHKTSSGSPMSLRRDYDDNHSTNKTETLLNVTEIKPQQPIYKGATVQSPLSGSPISLRKDNDDNQSTNKTDTLINVAEMKPQQPIYKEATVQTHDVVDVKDSSTSTTACMEHLSTFLSIDGKCGLCDFVHSGEHHRWNNLEDDATLFKDVSKNITKWLQRTPEFTDKIVLQKMEAKQKIRITLRKDKTGAQQILVTDGGFSYQIQGKRIFFK
ncbi:uncharacterized protein NPIL_441411 [Nephila pilipes]|uniref:Uncharacterized protein n=1 Tax=Nephila pilipes TaxID=299642 RepID=A0A8X6UEJ5_NEPPI|nr:uncharacterized protein NPIL_441411 [Nephila pilipes]